MSSLLTPPSSPSGGFWSIERVVALLTPVFSLGAGVVVTIVGKDFGVKLDPGSLVALMGIGVTAALAPALKWLHGRSQFTLAEQHTKLVLQSMQRTGGIPLEDIEKALAEHEQVIIKTLGDKIGAPPSVQELAQEVVRQLIGQKDAQAAASPASPTA